MLYSTLWRAAVAVSVTAFSVLLTGLTTATKTLAAPADVFAPHLDRIQQALPPKFIMRLPPAILLSYPADEEFIETLIVRVVSSGSPEGLTIGLYSCADNSPYCLIGTFSVFSLNASIAQQHYQQHQAAAAPIQLTDTVQGYVSDKIATQFPFQMSSVMWQQDDLFYKLHFATPERQNMLYMAVSMANEAPIYALNPILRDIQAQTSNLAAQLQTKLQTTRAASDRK